MKLLILGATGFVGRNLAACAREHGHEVWCAGREPTRLEALAGDSFPVGRYTAEEGPDEKVTGWLDRADAIAYLCGLAHQSRALSRSNSALDEQRRISVDGSRAALQNSRGKFIYLSSAGVLGCSSLPEIVTESTPCHPVSAYAVAKLEAEQELLDAGRERLVILRPPLVYGPGNPGNLARLMGLIRRKLPLPFGGLANRRSLIYVRNLAEAILRVSQTGDGVFYVADQEALSTPDLITQLARAMGLKARLVAVPPTLLKGGLRLIGRQAEYAKLCESLLLSTTRIRERTGWLARISAHEGLAATGRSVKQNPGESTPSSTPR